MPLDFCTEPFINLLQCNRQQVFHAERGGYDVIWTSM